MGRASKRKHWIASTPPYKESSSTEVDDLPSINDNLEFGLIHALLQGGMDQIVREAAERQNVETTTARYKTYGGNSRLYIGEVFNPREDTESFAAESHYPEERARLPNTHHYKPRVDNPAAPPKNWRPVHSHKDKSWPVGTIIITIFLSGVFCLFIFSRIMAWRESRRPVMTSRTPRARRSPGRRRDLSPDDLGEDHRRRVAVQVTSGEAPRLVTPPPPYPGSPSEPSGYVNPLHNKPSIQPSGTTCSNNSPSRPIGRHEEPPPYPGH